MQSLEVSGAVRPVYGSLGVKRLILFWIFSIIWCYVSNDVSATEFVCVIRFAGFFPDVPLTKGMNKTICCCHLSHISHSLNDYP